MNRSYRIIYFLILFAIISAISYVFKIILLAPPFAVSAYLITVESRGRFSDPNSIIVSYLLVIALTTIFHIFLGVQFLSIYLNVSLIAIFITLSRFRHPPAIALAIFSYIAHNDILFVESSLVIAAILWLADRVIYYLYKNDKKTRNI
ncbi:hypothetical protein DMB44_07835 [Thermoplasma sp. Kam2015]|uniref:HPP family protein n=1 Tax=Thermoplasma sp. Kam2015 TaxID=2094122 RepID=UPI000D90E04D|nr:HPP family protein [Thermoplasma sp. Kam2015]PYB67781.1 hypothetical protein DMB44_07835 [Thermoplasma sp. Kam2015]